MSSEKNKAKVTHLPIYIENKPKKSLVSLDEYRKYKIGDLLGSGGFAQCFRAVQVFSNHEYAIKIVNKKSDNMTKHGANERLRNQIQIMRRLKHPNILRLVEKFQDDYNHYLVLELCKKLSLSEMLKRKGKFLELEVKYFIRQLVLAAIYLKEMHILHRDIKTPNILLDDNLGVKLADFGLAINADTEDPRAYGCCGTPSYMAPEVTRFESQPHVRYSYEADLWSIGVVAYVLLFTAHPFYHSTVRKEPKNQKNQKQIQKQNQKRIYENIRSLKYPCLSKGNVSSVAKDFITRIFVVDPKKRLTIQEAISHEFLCESIPARLPTSWDTKQFRYSELLGLCRTQRPPSVKFVKARPIQINEGKNRSITSYFSGVNLEKNLFRPAKKEKKPEKTEQIPIESVQKTVKEERLQQMEPFEIKINPHQLQIPEQVQPPKLPSSPPSPKPDAPQKTVHNYYQHEQSNPQQKIDLPEAQLNQSSAWLEDKLMNQPYVEEFRDLSQRFGLCFRLNNGVIGVMFNDKTSMVICAITKEVVYVEPGNRKLEECERLLFRLVRIENEDQGETKYVLQKGQPQSSLNPNPQPRQKREARNHKITHFKSHEPPTQESLIKKYFFLKDCTRSLLEPKKSQRAYKIDLQKCAMLIRKWGCRPKSQEYIFKTSAHTQVIFPDGSCYFLNGDNEVILWNQTESVRKVFGLPLENKELGKKMRYQVEAIKKMAKYLSNGHRDKNKDRIKGKEKENKKRLLSLDVGSL